MSETLNITQKLLKARQMIKETSIQKEGTNTFSKYDYFTPSQVSELVNDVCQDLGILAVFSLRKDEFGLYGELQLTNLLLEENGGHETLTTQMRTEMPSITATNMTQQMGGCETYTKRYMLMSAFDITDNNLDFDSQDNRPKKIAVIPESETIARSNPELSKKLKTEERTPKTPVKTTQVAPNQQTLGEDEIPLNIACCDSMEDLNEIWAKLTKQEKERYGEQFTKRKVQISVNK